MEIKSQSETVSRQSKFLLKRKSQVLDETMQEIVGSIAILLSARKKEMEKITEEIKILPADLLARQKEKLGGIEKNVTILDPINVLKRGFSITLFNGKVLKSCSEVKPSDKITTVLADGQVESEVNTSDKSNNI